MHCYLSVVLLTHLNISVRADGQTFVGEQFSLACEIAQAEGLMSQQLSIEWLDSQGNPVVTGSGVSIQGPVRVDTRTTLTLNFDSLSLEHSQSYICLATLPSQAPPFELVREVIQNVNIGKSIMHVQSMDHIYRVMLPNLHRQRFCMHSHFIITVRLD